MLEVTQLPLLIFFLFIATLYSSVGLGGGTSYIAVLFLFGLPYQEIPLIALVCNIFVVLISSLNYLKNKRVRWDILTPLIIASIPAAYLGGLVKVSQKQYILLLSASLTLAGVKLIFFKAKNQIITRPLSASFFFKFILGATIGLLSGMVGIGGGIYLAPILYFTGWCEAKFIPPIIGLFILFNSASGLAGQWQKGGLEIYSVAIIPLVLAVVIGGFLGSTFSMRFLSARRLEVLTGIIICIIGVKSFF